ncbi:hypothetical protein [Eilatimonas milleporae]|uniref:Uncharacterized protein n=1 Tax=Eilatimonas milleporae TaxID=911205 RepID=A0A3M0CR61_9PROT|nr:hypothetical protein [Eilatimonas milleporae]RMB11982.1 hypothetical protein BXY39_0470 [Eilatimonas milleporae]
MIIHRLCGGLGSGMLLGMFLGMPMAAGPVAALQTDKHSTDTITLKITSSNGLGLDSIAGLPDGQTCTFPATTGPTPTSCSVSVTAGTRITMTPGFNTNGTGLPGVLGQYFVTGGSGLCTNAVSGPFTITVDKPKTGDTADCTIDTGTYGLNGLWGYEGQADVLSAGPLFGLSTHVGAAISMDGAALTYLGGTDGRAVWYGITAQPLPDAPSGAPLFTGTASEFTGGGAVEGGPSQKAYRLKSVVADIRLAFDTPESGRLTWTPHSGGTTITKEIVLLQPVPMADSVTSATNGTTPGPFANGRYMSAIPDAYQQGVSYFASLIPFAHGTALASTFLNALSFDPDGAAIWHTGLLEAIWNNDAWQVGQGTLTRYKGGNAIDGTGKGTLKAVDTLDVTGALSDTTGTLTLARAGGGHVDTTLSPDTGWKHGTWLQVLNENTTLAHPNIAFFPAGGAMGSQVTYFKPGAGSGFEKKTVKGWTSIPLADIVDGSLFIRNDPGAGDTGINGTVYLSDDAMSFPGKAGPNPTDCNDPNFDIRWQPFEVGGDYDLTYINVYAIPVAMRYMGFYNQGTATQGQLKTLKSDLLAAASVTPATLPTCTKTNGDKVTIKPDMSTRILSPVYDDTIGYYPGFGDAVKNAPWSHIVIADQYNGVAAASIPANPPCADSAYQPLNYQTDSLAYTFQPPKTKTGHGKYTLTVKGHTWSPALADPDGPKKGGTPPNGAVSFTMTADTLSPDAFSKAIMESVVSYNVTSTVCQSGGGTVSDQNGSNDVFSAIARDLLAGFSSGFINSSAYVNGGAANQWSYQWWTTPVAFAGLGGYPVPAAGQANYNVWGNAVFKPFGFGVYGFQYGDRFKTASPLVPVSTGPVELILLEEGPTP